jgi:arginase
VDGPLIDGPLIAVPGSFTGRADIGPGTEALARRLGERHLGERHLGEPQVLEPDVAAVRAALEGRPVVVSSECVVALATLPWVAERHPDARVLWLDAHPDFNTPGTSPSGYRGGMPVAGATGQWDAGVRPVLAPDRLVFAGVRDVDPGEQELLDRSGATVVDALDDADAALGDAPVFVHLDCDVIDGYPAAFPVPGGPSADAVRALLARVARDHEVIGLTVTAVAGSPDVPASVIEPLL